MLRGARSSDNSASTGERQEETRSNTRVQSRQSIVIVNNSDVIVGVLRSCSVFRLIVSRRGRDL